MQLPVACLAGCTCEFQGGRPVGVARISYTRGRWRRRTWQVSRTRKMRKPLRSRLFSYTTKRPIIYRGTLRPVRHVGARAFSWRHLRIPLAVFWSMKLVNVWPSWKKKLWMAIHLAEEIS